jgi:hypothetical protein
MAEDLVLKENPVWVILGCIVTAAFAAAFLLFVPPLWLKVLAALSGADFIYEALARYAYYIVLGADGAVEFRSVLRRRATTAWNIRDFKQRTWGWGEGGDMLARVKFDEGSVLLRRSEARTLAVRIRELNPSVTIRGF